MEDDSIVCGAMRGVDKLMRIVDGESQGSSTPRRDFVLRGGVDLDLMTAAQAIEQLDGVVSNPAPDGG